MLSLRSITSLKALHSVLCMCVDEHERQALWCTSEKRNGVAASANVLQVPEFLLHLPFKALASQEEFRSRACVIRNHVYLGTGMY